MSVWHCMFHLLMMTKNIRNCLKKYTIRCIFCFGADYFDVFSMLAAKTNDVSVSNERFKIHSNASKKNAPIDTLGLEILQKLVLTKLRIGPPKNYKRSMLLWWLSLRCCFIATSRTSSCAFREDRCLNESIGGLWTCEWQLPLSLRLL